MVFMTTLVQHIQTLAGSLAAHNGVTHWTISKMVSSKSDLIHRLDQGGDINTKTYETVMQRFHDAWPDDLEWPTEIPRPLSNREVA